MPRKTKFRLSKARIRHLIRRLAEDEVDDVDRFREHVHDARAKRQSALQKRAESLPLEVQEFLADETRELDIISRLADQLSIVALYRVVETNTGRMVAHEFGKAAAKKATYIEELKKLLREKKGVELTRVPHYRAIDELRRLNNEIKHAGLEGKKLDTLGMAYARFRPKVPAYIFRLAERMRLRYR